jgi:hypothetical protein
LVYAFVLHFHSPGDRVFVSENIQITSAVRGHFFFKTFFSGALINTFALGFKNLEISPE